MKKSFIRNIFNAVLLTALVACLVAGCSTVSQTTGKANAGSFSIVILPDTQIYAESFPDTFYKQTEWIKNNAKEQNIKCVIHVGDITNKNTAQQWEVVDKAFSSLRGVIPFAVARGNHDNGPNGDLTTMDSEGFDKTFSVATIEKEPWYGGKLGNNLANAWYKLDVGKAKFLILCLNFQPKDEILEWANGVLDKNSNRQAIIVTHAYLQPDGVRIKQENYPCGGNYGEDIWTKLVSKHDNSFMVLCGHSVPSAYSKAEGKNGTVVHQIMSDYQDLPEGGQGWLRIMKFDPQAKKIFITTYSPVLDKFLEDERNKLELDWQTKK
jgi:hypothetical protein